MNGFPIPALDCNVLSICFLGDSGVRVLTPRGHEPAKHALATWVRTAFPHVRYVEWREECTGGHWRIETRRALL